MPRPQPLPRGLYVRKDGTYWGDVTDKRLKRHRFSLETKNRNAAISYFEKDREKIIAESRGLREKDTNVETFLENYLEAAKVVKSENVFETDRKRLQAFFAHTRVHRLEDLSPDHFTRYFNHRVETGRKRVGTDRETGEPVLGSIRRSTAAHDVRTVRTALNWAVSRKLIPENPCPGPDEFRGEMRRRGIPYMTMEERDRLLLSLALPVPYRRGEGARITPDEGIPSRTRETPLYEIASVAFFTGFRIEEILRLDWEDVSIRRLEISIREKPGLWRPKDREERTVPLFPELLRILLPLRREGGPVFSTSEGTRFSKRNLLRDLQKVARREGIRVENGRLPNWIVTRHTFATQLVSNGVPIYTVSNWLGHSSVSITERHYAEFVPKEALVRQAAQALMTS